MRYAAVAERLPDGRVTRLLLPDDTVSDRVPYMMAAGRGWIQAGWVTRDGSVEGMDLGRPDPAPGTRLVAATDGRGRVVLVSQLPAKPKRRVRR